MTLLALASPVPGAMGAWLDARLASGLVLALPLGLAGLAFLRFGLLGRLGSSVLEPREPFGRGAAAGLAAALVLLVTALLPPALLGAFRPGAAGYRPFSPEPGPASLASAPASFGFFALQSLAEELLFRAFFLTLLAAMLLFLARLFFGKLSGMSEPLRGRAAARRWLVSGLLANAGQSVAFASMHAVNPNVTPLALLNIGLAGALLGWLYWSQGGFLGCWTFHALWNFTLAALALPVSGMTMGRPALATGIHGAGLPALSGGAFGPEGSVLSTVTLAALLVFLVRRSARKLPARILPLHERRKAAVHVSRVREVLLLLGLRGRVPAEGEVLLLQRGDFPERRATRASGSGTGAAGSHPRRRGSARRREPASGDLRRSVSDALEALAAAVRKGDAGAVEALLAADPALVNARRPDGSSFVLFAVYCGHPRLVEVFRERGRSLDLFEATAAGDAPAARAFLAKDPGAANATSPDGFPVLGLALFFGHSALAELLLDSGADPNAASLNAMRVTPLHAATSRGDAAMVKKLLDKGADPDARQQGGWTCLHNAASQGNVEIVRLLRARGADVTARTDDGKTAADLAEERGHAVLAESLRQV